MRPDKTILAAVAATLGLYRAGVAVREVPVWRQIVLSVDASEARARAIAAAIDGVRVVETEATVGGGSLPGETLPSRGVALPGRATTILSRLRAGSPAVVGRIERDEVVVDLRTIEPADDEALIGAIRAAVAGRG